MWSSLKRFSLALLVLIASISFLAEAKSYRTPKPYKYRSYTTTTFKPYKFKTYKYRSHSTSYYKPYKTKTYTYQTTKLKIPKTKTYTYHTTKIKIPKTYTYTTTPTYKFNGTTYMSGQTYATTGLPKVKRSESAIKKFLKSKGYSKIPPGYEVDHIIPLHDGGLDVPSNMQLLTKEHHKLKTANEERKVVRKIASDELYKCWDELQK